MIVGMCAKCGAPASLRCAMCGNTFCRNHLDQDERMCPDCTALQKRQRGSPGVPLPPSRRLGRA
jgi:hypothetical protein